jgi:proteic killer suppression protein
VLPHPSNALRSSLPGIAFGDALLCNAGELRLLGELPAGLDISKSEYILLCMWVVVETKAAEKAIGTLQKAEKETYQIWLQIVRLQGPLGLRAIKGFHDEKLEGPLKHLRSSRLSKQWRVIYSVEKETVTVKVERVTPHDYRG